MGKSNEKTPLLPITNADGSFRPPLVSSDFDTSGTPEGLSRSPLPRSTSPMIEQGISSQEPQPFRRDILQVDRDIVIETSKAELVESLSHKLGSEDKEDFMLFGERLMSAIRAHYHHNFEKMLQIYRLFDPHHAGQSLAATNLKRETVEHVEMLFLRLLLHMLQKANFTMLSDAEVDVALQGTYLLNVPIRVDTKKLDQDLLSRFIKEAKLEDVSHFANMYFIFRRGVGIDLASGWFVFEKIDLVLNACWRLLLIPLCLAQRRGVQNEGNNEKRYDVRKDKQDNTGLLIERIRLENMRLRWRMLFSKNTIQEPTFERVILIYRTKTPPSSSLPLGERSICLKQFRHIPMADLEIVLPEKKTPGLRPVDWFFFTVTILGGLGAVFASIQLEFSPTVVLTLFVALGSYVLKVYFAWRQNMDMYQALLQQSMYDKQLDSGRGTLLHLFNNVEHQEFKEALLGYFVLLTEGPTYKEELRDRCELYLRQEFNENVKFDTQGAIRQLLKMKIAVKDASGLLTAHPLKIANEIIGPTTEESFGSVSLAKYGGDPDTVQRLDDIVTKDESLDRQFILKHTICELSETASRWGHGGHHRHGHQPLAEHAPP